MHKTKYSFLIYYPSFLFKGYGDITPQNEKEKLLAAFTILIACSVFGYSINEIGSIIQ
jgi:hypothetical protein